MLVARGEHTCPTNSHRPHLFKGSPTLTLVFSQILQLALQCLATSSYRSGMGKHDSSLYPEELMTILRDNWVSVPPGIFVGLLS